MASRSPWFRFRLRTLLLVMLLLGGGMGWWLRPFTLTKRWPNGRMQYELHVRRTWDGTLVTNGRQRWWWSNGQLARDGSSVGREMPRVAKQLILDAEQCWHENGEPLHTKNFAHYCLILQLLKDRELKSPYEESIYLFPETEHDP